MDMRLREARVKAGFKTTHAAAAALRRQLGKGCYTSLYNAEKGQRVPGPALLCAIARLYGVSVEYLVNGGIA